MRLHNPAVLSLLPALLLNAAFSASSAFPDRFANPPAESRMLKIIHSWPDDPGAQDRLITSLSNQGFGGVVCNVSFADYLQSDAKWNAFAGAVAKAKKAGFALWLYDEKGYPSATAGGLVLKANPEWEARGLLIADVEVERAPASLELPPGKPTLIAAYPVLKGVVDIRQGTNLSGRVQAHKVSWTPPAGRWRVLAITEDRLYEGTHASMSLAEHIPYPNLLDPQPTAKFLELTHAAYAKHLGTNLGQYFVSTFTDEPSLMSLFLRPMPYRVLPWSTNLVAEFRRRHGSSIEDKLPALVCDIGPETAAIRFAFWDTVGQLVSENFFGQIQHWCQAHRVLSGGHLLMEENLVNHVPLYGDFFRCLRRLDAPGIDCLTSIPEQVPWFVARLAASAAELEGRTVTMCEASDHSQRYRPAGDRRPIRKVSEDEIRGTCNRLFVGGIDTLTSYYSFDGLGNDQLRRLNEYVGRCSGALSGGHQAADIAVLYPVESIWTRFTPARHYANDSPGAARIENIWRDVSESLFAAGRDFTYVDGRALAHAKVERGALVHGSLRWRVVILPGADTLPLQAWRNLAAFVRSGGVLLSIGSLPANSEADFPCPEVKTMAAEILNPGADKPSVQPLPGGGYGIFMPAGLASLVPDTIDRVLAPDLDTGGSTTPLRFTHRSVGGHELYFVINDSQETWTGKISLSVEGPGQQWDPLDGACTQLSSGQNLELKLPAYGSTLYRFAKSAAPARKAPGPEPLPGLALRELPSVKPTVARGEFVREEIKICTPPGWPQTAQTSNAPVWQASARIIKGQVDTFLFLRFEYTELMKLQGARALVLDTWAPENQHAPAQLLVILHEKGGADYLAHTGRMLSSSGHERTWIALDRFQLAGWSQDANSRLNLDEIAEIRVGWGGYYGKEGEQIVFAAANPSVTRMDSRASSGGVIDLRPQFEKFALARRRQGARPTCSVFTVVGALEFALAQREGSTPRLSIDFLNWAANQACGENDDGSFFSDLWRGFEKYGICAEAGMPYEAKFDPKCAPGTEALAEAAKRLGLGLRLHWIKEWNVKTGLRDSEFEGVRQTLRQGWPVCGGFRWPIKEQWKEDVLQMCSADAVRDGHSVLLVGFRDDSDQPGGGVFIFRNTGGQGRDGFMPYAYARKYMNDAVWVDYATAPAPAIGIP